jgi:CheY-like chemotaxis protein
LQRDLHFEDHPVDPDLFVKSDRQRLVQVLLNLLSNAVKYNRPAGSLGILCEETVSAAGQRMVRIGVHDTGEGLPAEKVDRLFIPFERLGAEQDGVEGTGLGLALSKRLVEAMGGTLIVESVPGEGSTFWVELEHVASPSVSADMLRLDPAAGSTDSITRPPAKILYIEDNVANLALVETILAERSEITLLSAVLGQIGIDLAVEHLPDLLLLDMHLPDVQGEEVLRRIKGDPRTCDIPVVVVSADATPATLRRLTTAGAVAYLTKPIDVGEFLTTIDRFLMLRSEAQ